MNQKAKHDSRISIYDLEDEKRSPTKKFDDLRSFDT